MFRYMLCNQKRIEQEITKCDEWESLCRELKQHHVTMVDISMIDISMLSDFQKKQQIAAEDSLMLAITKQEAEWSAKNDIAAVGCELIEGEDLGQVQLLFLELNGISYSSLNQVYLRQHNLPWTILTTARCYLREMTLEDMDDLWNLYHKEHVTDFIEPLYEYEEEVEYQRAYIQHMYGFYGYGMWLIKEKGSNQLIGRAGIDNRVYDDEIELELGYVIDPDYQKKGYATEVCTAIITWVRERLDFDRINCLTEQENAASIALLCKLGFHWEEELTQDGKVYQRYILSL